MVDEYQHDVVDAFFLRADRGSVYLSIYQSIYLPTYLSIYQSIYLPTYLSI